MCVRVTSEAPGGFEEGGVHGAGRDSRGGARLAAARAGTQMKRARVIGEGRRCGQDVAFLTAGLYSAFRARMAILRRSSPVLRFVVATRFLGGEERRSREGGGEDSVCVSA